jgi:hypothetical protein
MTFRVIPESLSTHRVAEIDSALALLAEDHGVRILHAVESGSRAWGFPSLDSDYDCRFIYVRPREAYLSLWQPRDVIELPIVGELDLNGWDLAKALRLLLKGNAVILEWLRSPIVYRGNRELREALLGLAERHVQQPMLARHYLHLGLRQQRLLLSDPETVPLKKLFYALRPAAALRWMRLNANAVIVPMHFPTLIGECDPPQDFAQMAAELIALKAKGREMGTGQLQRPMKQFLQEEFSLATEGLRNRTPSAISAEARAEADACFLAFAP